MLAEQVDDSRDRKILPGFDLHDIDIESLHRYRQMLSSLRPDHPWNALPDQEFLRVQGGFRQDRQSGEKGLTLAGLLMFGQWPSIQEAVPDYFVDYQEQGEDKGSRTRWLDRVVPDGTWSGNIFDFFLKISRKLTADLKVPFLLKGHVRQDDTLLHRALREALVNTLVHADYSDRASILITKDPQGFLFRNPGLMRVPTEQALRGGESDCRNQTLHQLFLMINLGERAGSGLPKIRQGWESNGGTLCLFDTFTPYDQTRLEMFWKESEGEKSKTPGKGWENAGETPGKTTAKILQFLASTPTMTIPELADLVNRSESAVERAIRKLRQTKKLKRIGPAKGGYWQVL
jgi:predicted HTH transcriptional regulator